MTESECLAKMVPPGQPRTGKMWGGGVMQILLTRACSKACYHCTQGSQLGGRLSFMSVDQFEQALLSLEGYFGLRALFGGQPTLHPQFPEIIEVLCKHVPMEKRGLWTNALNGYGALCRRTFLPQNCNLNVHMDREDYEEFRRDWPEAHVVGLNEDSRHSPCYVAMKDVLRTECPTCFGEGRTLPRTSTHLLLTYTSCPHCNGSGQVYDTNTAHKLISACDINQKWSAGISTFRGEVRGYFCEIAMAQAGLHQWDDDWQQWDTGVKNIHIPFAHHTTGELIYWWQQPMTYFVNQVRQHCHNCSIPLKGYGELSQSTSPDSKEQVSATHQGVYKPKRKDRRVELVTVPEQLGKPLGSVVRYLQNSHL